jgi:hypothetical protein
MKKIVTVVLSLVLFSSCGSDSMNSVEENMPPEMTETKKLQGDFMNGAHPTSGIAIANEENTKLNFQNFKTDDGPKLLVYLTTAVGSSDFVDLGDLKGISGDFQYAIPANTDLSKYKIVDIWCVDFSVSFGSAELK